MRKSVLYGLFVSLFLTMASCMGDGSNTINYHRVGVIRENPMRCIYTSDDQGNIFIVSSSEFENRTDLDDGDCCVVDFKTNFSEELAGGVYDAEIYKYDSVAVWPLHETLTDTAVILDNECLVTLDFAKSIYLEGRFFLQTQHTNHQEDQRDIFNLSYDSGREAEEDSTGQRVYNLYLRVTREGGTGDSSRWINTTAFAIDTFLDQAKTIESGAGQNTINFKINYAERYNADTTASVWGATDVFTLRFTN